MAYTKFHAEWPSRGEFLAADPETCAGLDCLHSILSVMRIDLPKALLRWVLTCLKPR